MGKMMDRIYSQLLNELVELEGVLAARKQGKVSLDTPMFIVRVTINNQPKHFEMDERDIYKYIESKAASLRGELTDHGVLKPLEEGED